MTDREYLQAANVVKLQAAARMAGLRFKSGTLDKAGIIARLETYPAILRACMSVLQRMEREGGTFTPPPAPVGNPLADDLADEPTETLAPVSSTGIPRMMPEPVRQETSQAVANALDTLGGRVTRLEGTAKNHGDILGQHNSAIATLANALQAVQQQRPIQINIDGHKPIVIDPANHHESYPKLIQYLQINRRVILVGSAGTGKSMAVKNAAAALEVPFYLVPPVTMSHELIGHRDAQGVFHETPLTLAYKHGGLCLLDEADASLPDALLCANPILDGNGFATLGDGVLHAMHPDFYAVLNMNTDGNGATMQYAGRNRLDGATVARFGVRIDWQIDARIENVMASGQNTWADAIRAIRKLITDREIMDVNATPRHLKTGAALLNAGVAKQTVIVDCLKNGALAECWGDVMRLPAVITFLRG